MGVNINSSGIKYVFTQAVAPSGEGEVEGSIWYDTVNKKLYAYDGSSWNSMATDPSTGQTNIVLQAYNSIVQGTWSLFAGGTATQLYAVHIANSSAANADEITYKIFLSAGTYTLNLIGSTGTNQGICDYYLDAVEIASHDWYAGVAAENVVKSTASIAVATTGLYTFKIKLDGKHASSSSYISRHNQITFIRTA